MQTWKVAVEAPLEHLLTYSSDLPVVPGTSVEVPLGRRQTAAVVVEPDLTPSTKFELKGISSLLSERPALSEALMKWALWIAKYYHYPPGEVFSLFFPSLKKTGRAAPKDLFDAPVPRDLQLTKEQAHVVQAILAEKDFSSHLLWGVTGSGKTEVYIELIKEKLAQGLGSMVLLPEIALTPQLVSRFRNRIGDQVAVLHSDLTDRERTNQWWSVMDEQKKVLIGARSALFCPMPKLGLIIVDEEHESSFKQDETLRYHARDCAVMRAHFEKIPVVLGSATPSLESWKNVQDKKYHLHHLAERASKMEMPEIEIVDMSRRDQQPQTVDLPLPFWLSETLYKALQSNYTQGFQSALFLNRRGVAQTVLCGSCGFIYTCPNCEITLTLHGKSHLVCHYCHYSEELGIVCPDCKQDKVKPVGLGTEQVQEDIQRLFPHARVTRVDRDEIDSRARMEEFVRKMENHEIDFLIGTQMIAKGLDFEKLTLVGIVLADIAFNIPDFRATERSYQLLTQVSGRSGRHHRGHVIVQTFRPDHPSLVSAQAYNTKDFLSRELVQREELNYPPFSRMACLKISGLHRNETEEMAVAFARELQELVRQRQLQATQILGPAPAPLAKIRNRFRFQILIKSKSAQELQLLLQYCGHIEGQFKKMKLQIDMDPYNLM